jgi:hypothetical protein
MPLQGAVEPVDEFRIENRFSFCGPQSYGPQLTALARREKLFGRRP